MEPWKVCRPVVAVLITLMSTVTGTGTVSDPHLSEKSNPDPQLSERRDPAPEPFLVYKEKH